jgi:hypothetical protein
LVSQWSFGDLALGLFVPLRSLAMMRNSCVQSNEHKIGLSVSSVVYTPPWAQRK